MANDWILTEQGAAFIARFEGYRATPYRCPAGKLTIGFGHVIQPFEEFTRLTWGDALELLKRDATREALPVSRAVDRVLLPYQADALISIHSVHSLADALHAYREHINSAR